MKRSTAEQPEVSWRYYPFLAHVSAVLTSSLDPGRTLRRVVHLPLPDLGAWCALHLLDRNGALRYTLAAHADSTAEATASALWQEAYECDPGVRERLNAVLRTGKPEVVLATALPDQKRGVRTSPLGGLLTLLDLQSVLLVPVCLRGHGIGVIAFGSPAARTYRASQLVAVASAYALRVAAVLDHARTYSRSHEALAARNMLMASTVHDLRNPLTVIKARAQSLRRSLSRGRAESEASRAQALDEGLAAIDAATTGIEQIIDDLLELMRDERSEVPVLQQRQHDVVALAQRLVTTYQQIAPRHEITMSAPGVERLAGVFDAGKVARALGNLLDNAIKYSPPGGRISIEIGREEQRDSGQSHTTPWAVIRVRDEGIGIPEADLATIFRPFVRGGNVQKRIPGSGVGLSGVRQIIEQHGGTVSVESALGRGSTFTVLLPLSAPWRSELSELAESSLGGVTRAHMAQLLAK